MTVTVDAPTVPMMDVIELRAGEKVLATQHLTAVCPWDVAMRIENVQVVVTNYRIMVSGAGDLDAITPMLMVSDVEATHANSALNGDSLLRIHGKDLSIRSYAGSNAVVLDVMRAVRSAREEWPTFDASPPSKPTDSPSSRHVDATVSSVGVSAERRGSTETVGDESSWSSIEPMLPPTQHIHDYRFSWAAERERWLARGRGIAPDDAAFENQWIVDTTINAGFGVCPSYPEEVVVVNTHPTGSVDSADLPYEGADLTRAAATFRTSARFPIVTWIHPTNGAALVRSSQPKTGAFKASSDADRALMRAIGTKRARGSARDDNERMTIADARPYLNAAVNQVKGGGYEDVSSYHKADIMFLNIGNIHDMRNARKRLADVLRTTGNNVLETEAMTTWAEASGNWYKHIEALIDGTARIVRRIRDGVSVLIHCSDGWDRTSQLSALASMLLDGRYRTARGFADVVSKDWLEAGHKFRHRLGLSSTKEGKQREESPIFVQFVEAVWLLSTIYPTHFEFSQYFLQYVVYHSFSGKYFTFLGNNVQERYAGAQFEKERRCLWTDLLRRVEAEPDLFKNPCYVAGTRTDVLCPSIMPYHFRLWESNTTRWMWGWLRRQSAQAGDGPACIDGTLCLEVWKRALAQKDKQIAALKARVAMLENKASPRQQTATAASPRGEAELACEEIMAEVLDNMLEEAADRSRERLKFSVFSAQREDTVWEPNDSRSACAVCDAAFTMFRRRHHCRVCGLLICRKCSPQKKIIQGRVGPQRVCAPCSLRVAPPVRKQPLRVLTSSTAV